jgi:hypothetical protein
MGMDWSKWTTIYVLWFCFSSALMAKYRKIFLPRGKNHNRLEDIFPFKNRLQMLTLPRARTRILIQNTSFYDKF